MLQTIGHIAPPNPRTPRMAPRTPRVFVGREQVLNKLIDALQSNNEPASPFAIVGIGGVGKTALVAALANAPVVEAMFPDGVLWIALGPKPDVKDRLGVWGSQLGDDFERYKFLEDRSGALSTLLHDKKALLVIDDVWEAGHALPFLVQGKACRVIITTRSNDVASELYILDPYQVEALSEEDSIKLIQKLIPTTAVTNTNDLHQLARQLGGLPLALTITGQMLAAELQAGLDIAGLLFELQERENQLELPKLQTTLKMSYDNLPSEESRRAFRLLGAFDGKPLSFSLNAAATVWEAQSHPARKMITTLVGRGLVEVHGKRYMLHPLLADFAAEILDHNESHMAHHRHAHYFLELARQYRADNTQRWRVLDEDWENIRRAINWLDSQINRTVYLQAKSDEVGLHLEETKDQQINLIKLRKTLTQLFNIEELRTLCFDLEVDYENLGGEGKEDIVRELIDHMERRGLIRTLVDNVSSLRPNFHLEDVLIEFKEDEQSASSSSLEIMESNLSLATDFAQALRYVINVRRPSESETWLRLGVTAAQKLGRSADEGWLSLVLGSLALEKGLWADAEKHYIKCRDLFELSGEDTGLRYTCGELGRLHHGQRHYLEAIACYEQVTSLCEKAGDIYGTVVGLTNQGDVYHDMDDIPNAIKRLQLGADLCRKANLYQPVLTVILGNLSELYLELDQMVEALAAAEESLKIAVDVGEQIQIGVTSQILGEIWTRNGDFDKAANYFVDSIRYLAEVNVQDELAKAYEHYGYVLSRKGQMEEAKRYLQMAFRIYQLLGLEEEANQVQQVIMS